MEEFARAIDAADREREQADLLQTEQARWKESDDPLFILPPPPLPLVDAMTSYKTFESLPEYRIYSHRLTQAMESLAKLNLQRSRYKVRHFITDTRGGVFSMKAEIREAIESSVIDEAHIVFTTVNSAGHPSLDTAKFSVTVIDEAAQCVEPSVLIPLRLGSQRCVLVGDPQQLPATIFSNRAKK
jgi:senataxin